MSDHPNMIEVERLMEDPPGMTTSLVAVPPPLVGAQAQQSQEQVVQKERIVMENRFAGLVQQDGTAGSVQQDGTDEAKPRGLEHNLQGYSAAAQGTSHPKAMMMRSIHPRGPCQARLIKPIFLVRFSWLVIY